jgi:DNA-binding NtrC family response regulator
MPAPTHKPKVAIIDDDQELTDELKNILADSGYEISVYNSPQFVNEFIKNKPDVLLVDVWFNGTADGLNEVRAVNFQEKLKPVPIILMSSDPKIAKYAEKVQADTYLSKPLDPEKLLTTLEQVLA